MHVLSPLFMSVALCLAGCAASTAPSLGPAEDLDQANPFVLNELAVASAQRGDLDTARLLLERATRLTPHDTRITQNLDAVRAARSGMPPPRRLTAAAPGPAPPAQPAIWPSP